VIPYTYGEMLRSFLGAATTVRSITDFGDLPVFESATAYPMIFVAQKAGPPGATWYTKVMSLAAPYPDVALVARRQGRVLAPDAIQTSRWQLGDSGAAELVRRMSIGTVPLDSYLGGQVYYGIKTGLNEAFYLTASQRDALIAEDPRSTDIIRPLLVGKDIRRWRAVYRDRWMIVTKIGVDMRSYPAVSRHLSQWRHGLEKRQDQGNHWWELRACAYYDAFERPKILFPDIATEPRFALDDRGAFADTTVFVIPYDDLYLLGVLNSSPVKQFFAELSPTVRGGYYRFKRQYVLQIPVPTAGPEDRQVVANLVADCLSARDSGTDTTHYEREIDARVAHLYGLDLAMGAAASSLVGTVG
jgi:hypothetical protein